MFAADVVEEVLPKSAVVKVVVDTVDKVRFLSYALSKTLQQLYYYSQTRYSIKEPLKSKGLKVVDEFRFSSLVLLGSTLGF